jgi:hypothetical protein
MKEMGAGLPYADRLVRNGVLEIDTILRIDSPDKVFAMLCVAKKMNCTVKFKNEDITVMPNGNQDEFAEIKQTMSIMMFYYFHDNYEKISLQHERALQLLKEGE